MLFLSIAHLKLKDDKTNNVKYYFFSTTRKCPFWSITLQRGCGLLPKLAVVRPWAPG